MKNGISIEGREKLVSAVEALRYGREQATNLIRKINNTCLVVEFEAANKKFFLLSHGSTMPRHDRFI